MALTTEHRALCQTELDRLVASTPGVRCAMLALRDGRPFVQSAADIDAGRFAAMASSMCALGDSVLKELSSGSLDHVLVDGSDGKLVISKVPGCGGSPPLPPHARNEENESPDDREPAENYGDELSCAARDRPEPRNRAARAHDHEADQEDPDVLIGG